jgi:hypothetical protein
MSGQKARRISPTIQKAEIQMAAIQRIDPNLRLGQGDSIETYAQTISEAQRQLDAYNLAAEALEAQRIALKESEKKVHAVNVKVLASVALEFSKESPQYSMVGGVRPSEIKRTARVSKAVPA